MPTTIERTIAGGWIYTLPSGVSPAGITVEVLGAIAIQSGTAAEARRWTDSGQPWSGQQLRFEIGSSTQFDNSDTLFGITPGVWTVRAAGRGLPTGFGGTLIPRVGSDLGAARVTFNRLPLAPLLTMPPNDSSIDGDTVQRFSWSHQDPDGDPQTQAQMRWREVGTSEWATHTLHGSTQHCDCGPGQFPLGDLEWQIRTRDAEGWGPWSTSRLVTVLERPTDLQIIAPVAGSTVTTPDLTIEWVAAEQDSATVIVKDITAPVSSDLIDTVGPDVREVTIPAAALTTGHTYEIRVYVTVNGLDSDPALITVVYDPTAPLPAGVTVMADNPPGMVSVHVTQPAPDDTPEVVEVDIERRFVPDPDRMVPVAGPSGPVVESVPQPEPEPVLLVAGLPAETVWTDATVPARRPVEYRVRARAASGAASTTGWHA